MIVTKLIKTVKIYQTFEFLTCDCCKKEFNKDKLIHIPSFRIPVKRQDQRIGNYLYCSSCERIILNEKIKEFKGGLNMEYILMWKGEEIDRTDDHENALYLQTEYNMAYNGGVTIKEVKK
jgi:hypothetical protein